MSLNLENCGILREDILNGVVDRLAESLDEDISLQIKRETTSLVEEAIGQKVETIVQDVIEAKVNELMNNDIQPLTVWGEKRGKPRTISDILSDSLTAFWSTKVDANGKKTERYGNEQTRVEYVVKKVANEVLTNETKNEFNQLILNAKASLSDALTKAVKEITDKHLDIKRK